MSTWFMDNPKVFDMIKVIHKKCKHYNIISYSSTSTVQSLICNFYKLSKKKKKTAFDQVKSIFEI